MSLQDEVKLLKQINEMQASRIEEQEKTIEDLRIVIDELRSIKANLEETLEEFKRQIFGVRSEKTSASKATEEKKEKIRTRSSYLGELFCMDRLASTYKR